VLLEMREVGEVVIADLGRSLGFGSLALSAYAHLRASGTKRASAVLSWVPLLYNYLPDLQLNIPIRARLSPLTRAHLEGHGTNRRRCLPVSMLVLRGRIDAS
jgi:hypothetical protein